MDEGVAERLAERARMAGIALAEPLRGALVAYYDVLARWNAKINLTGLTDRDEAIDRLLLEPVAAAALLPAGSKLMDLGSGGGSPAIPLALGLHAQALVMVESRGRKAAFLREASRAVRLPAVVEAARFEDLSSRGAYRGSADIVSMRAVRMDEEALEAAATFLRPDGILASFVASGANVTAPPCLRFSRRSPLPGRADLLVFLNVPRGT